MIRLLLGDMRARCADLPEKSIHSVTTSIPYYGLRSYGTEPQVWGGCGEHAHGFTPLGDRPANRPKRDHAGAHDFGDTRGEEQYRAGTVAPTSQGAVCDHAHEWSDPVRAPWANEVTGPETGGKNDHRQTSKTAGQVCIGHHHEHEWSPVVRPAANGITDPEKAMQGETLSGMSATRAPTTSYVCVGHHHEHQWEAVEHRSESSVRSAGRRDMKDVGRDRNFESAVCVAPCEHVWQSLGEHEQPKDAQQPKYHYESGGSKGLSSWGTRDVTVKAGGGAICENGCGAWLGELGLEPTFQMFLEHVREAFRAIHRVLRDDGTLWLNVGDSYAGSNNGSNDHRQEGKHHDRKSVTSLNPVKYVGQKPGTQSLRAKNKMMMPARVAIALQEDHEVAWILRQEILWLKTNPMPESTRSRPNTASERIYLFVKSDDTTFWLHPTKGGARKRPKADFVWIDRANNYAESAAEPEGWKTERLPGEGGKPGPRRWRRVNQWEGFDYFYDDIAARIVASPDGNPGRNMLDYWLVSSDPCPDAHFATFPRKIPEWTIQVGTSERGACPACGAPWMRIVERPKGSSWHDHEADLERGQRTDDNQMKGDNFYRHYATPRVVGWSPTCECFCGECQGDGRQVLGYEVDGLPVRLADSKCPTCGGTGSPRPVPCQVLDPFGGSGRTAVAADRLNRDAVIVEIKPSYALIAHKTMGKESPMFTRIECDPLLETIQELADAEQRAGRHTEPRPDQPEHADVDDEPSA